MKKICRLICFVCAAVAVTACYRAPSAEDYSIYPMTNNREITREPPSMMQGVKM